MIPVKQTRLYTEDLTKPPGNCFQACLASIFELSIDKVPDEIEVWNPREREENWVRYYKLVQDWLTKRNLTFIEIRISPAIKSWNDTYEIITGRSPRNKGLHSCVGMGGKIIFDPHPDNTGLLEQNNWTYGVFVTINPSITLPKVLSI